jgi:glutamate/aspartate transport system substrate-binding protein
MKRLAWFALAVALATGPALAAEQPGTLDKIKKSGEIVIGHRQDARPFSFVESDGKPTGYTVDLCLRIVDGVKNALGVPNLRVKYVPLTAENRFAKVADGSVDLECGNSTMTLSRMEEVDFSNMIFITGASMLVRPGEQIGGLSDLAGKSVAVVEDTTTRQELQDKLKAGSIDAKVVPVKDHADGLKALLEKKVDAYAGDQIVLIGLAKSAEDPGKLALVRELFSYEPYGIALRRGDADFRLVANRALAQLYRSGGITGVYDRWFGDWGGRPSPLLVAMYALNGIPE